MTMTRRTFAAHVGALATVAAAPLRAQDYPAKPIRLIIPSPPGGALDTYVRAVQADLQTQLGQPIVPENVPGAGGAIGAMALTRAQPDGYTLMAAPVQTLSMNSAVNPKLTYDPIRDFVPVVRTVLVKYMLVVRSSLDVKSLSDLIAYAKAHPGKLSYGTSGPGSPQHMAVALLQAKLDLDCLHVGYKGMGPAITDLLGGQVDFTIADQPSLMAHVKSGRLRALASAGRRRMDELPDVPTIAEAARLPDYEAAGWQGIVAPVGTPTAVIQRVNEAVNKIQAKPDVSERLKKLGYELVGGSSEDFKKYLAADVAKWKKVARDNNITAD